VRVVQVGEGFDFAGVGILSGVDPPYPFGQGGGLPVAARGVVGGRGGQAGGEQSGAVGPEDTLGEEVADDVEQGVFTDRDRPGMPVGDGVAGVSRVVLAGVVGVHVVGSIVPVAGAVRVIPDMRCLQERHRTRERST
jgi:hypothetical protein